MTAILAYREGRSAWIGGDACISDGSTKAAGRDPKVWRPMPGVLSGASGSLAWCDAVAWVDWPARSDITDAWIRRDLAAVLNRAMRGVDADEGDEGIVVVGDRIYVIEAISGVAYQLHDDWAATGSGAREALAACAASVHLRGAARVRRSLEIAGKYASGVGPPYLVLKS